VVWGEEKGEKGRGMGVSVQEGQEGAWGWWAVLNLGCGVVHTSACDEVVHTHKQVQVKL
jgi:hypothetical protein